MSNTHESRRVYGRPLSEAQKFRDLRILERGTTTPIKNMKRSPTLEVLHGADKAFVGNDARVAASRAIKRGEVVDREDILH